MPNHDHPHQTNGEQNKSMTDSTKPEASVVVTVCTSPEEDLWAANEAQRAMDPDVDGPEALARRIMNLASWEPRAALDNATAYIRIDRKDAFTRGQRSRDEEMERLTRELAEAGARVERLCECICEAAPLAWAAKGDMGGAQEWERAAHDALNCAGYTGAHTVTDEQQGQAVADVEYLCRLLPVLESEEFDAAMSARARITAALAGRGVR